MKSYIPRKALSKAFLKSPISRVEIEQFKGAFVTMQGKIDPDQTEEYLKNNIRDFLLDAYYKGDYQINVKDRKDLVIHNGPKSTDTVGVIIEAKSIKNTTEMVTREDLNKKALRELILYYLREREDEQNINIKHLIITNANEWFVFDANLFEKLVYRDVKLLKSYKTFRREGKDTKHFYDAIAKPFIDKIQDELEYTWFDISKYKNIITNNDQEDDRKLVALFKLLSPTHILKQSFTNDSNSLNKNFYNELLHLIGLEEVSQKGKKVIQRKAEGKRESTSLLENTITILGSDTNVPTSAHFDTALELCITWINRVLFLKLLESQLITYNKGDKSYRFLDFDRIGNYDALNKLFFQVLAIKPADRKQRVQEEYSKVPYLNSSLFEVSPIESKSIRISGLEDDGELSIYSTTVLKGEKGKRAKGSINALEYLFRFLEAYNFSSEGGEQIQEESKSLINASVLGLIFEKINGYKDGSFFTPGFITMYMCSETIRRSVMQKFREQTDYDSEEWSELKNYIGKPYKKEDLQKYNTLIDSIKICDPAVGSGHFLVSALNEIIAIKSELGILCSADYQKLPIIATVDNDELILETDDGDNELYEYEYKNSESQRVQKAIFSEKKKIIENCLFGVDINPNSVKICRLRLWIELLKNAYYTAESKYTDLETLPNIDINIKCGNSLISRFGLDSDLSSVFGKDGNSKDKYLTAVTAYKQTADKEAKQELKSYIDSLKEKFKTTLLARDKRFGKLSKWRGDLNLIKNKDKIGDLFGKLSDNKENKKALVKKAKTLEKNIAKLEKEMQAEKEGQFFKKNNAFEWRFEFPEVLDDEGKYVGFDVVIGNPPWGVKFDSYTLHFIKQSHSDIVVRMIDSFMFFINLSTRLIIDNGSVAQIVPDVLLYQSDTILLRKKLLLDYRLDIAINLGDNIFHDVSRPSCIVIFSGLNRSHSYLGDFGGSSSQDLSSLRFDKVKQDEILKFPNSLIPFRNIGSYRFFNKIKGQKLSDFLDSDGIQRGVSPDYKNAFIINSEMIAKSSLEAEYLRATITGGRDTDSYYTNTIDKYLIYTRKQDDMQLFPNIVRHITSYSNFITCKEVQQDKHPVWSLHRARNRKIFEKKSKILGVITGDTIKVSLDDSFIFPTDGMYLMCTNGIINNIQLVGVLNSKLATFLYQLLSMEVGRTLSQVKPTLLKDLPLSISTSSDQSILVHIEQAVTQIIALKKVGQRTDHLEAEIDVMVYKLYELTYAEVLIVDPEFGMTEAEYGS